MLIFLFLGTEFTSQKPFLDSLNIDLIMTRTGIKASYAENRIKHVMKKVYKYLTINSTLRWIDVLPLIQTSFNQTPSPSLNGYSPLEIVESKEIQQKLKRFYAKQLLIHHKKVEKKKFRILPVGSKVRKLYAKKIFDKSYQPTFSQEIYIIAKIKGSSPVQYFLENDNKPYYRQELSPVNDIVEFKRKDLFVAGSKKSKQRKTRSGATYGQDTLYLIKSRSEPLNSGKYVTQKELDNYRRKGIVE